ncbi:hypothetical protein OG21DRAFT_639548 [Imleria badia]|nr:hypothetical protein OG21DRAFT_639548 [Imleria badia]
MGEQQQGVPQLRDDVPTQTGTTTTMPGFDIGHAVTRRSLETGVDSQEKKWEHANKLEEILKWLDGLNCAERQDVTLSLRQPDTCMWLFDTTPYMMWRDRQSSFLWLRGKPGAGKSVLASSVIDSLEKSRGKREVLAFFHCDFRNERSTSAAEVMRSILSQLLCQLRDTDLDLGSLINDLVTAKERGGATRDSAKQLATFASRTAMLSSQTPSVVVDALDECICRDIEALLEGLVVLEGHARLFVTSRPLQVIKDGISGHTFVSLDDMAQEVSADIGLHVARKLDACRRLRKLDSEFKTKIMSVLCHRADGMFRWVAMFN